MRCELLPPTLGAPQGGQGAVTCPSCSSPSAVTPCNTLFIFQVMDAMHCGVSVGSSYAHSELCAHPRLPRGSCAPSSALWVLLQGTASIRGS